MQYTLYHIAYESDTTARRSFYDLAKQVHAADGAIWGSLSHGSGPSYVVIALPTDTQPGMLPEDARTPVASIDGSELYGLDTLFIPVVPVAVSEVPAAPEEEEEANV